MKSEGLAGLTTVSVDWEEPAVIILDQTQLPNREAYLRLYTPEEIWEAIYHLKVRGGPGDRGCCCLWHGGLCTTIRGTVFFRFFSKIYGGKKIPGFFTSYCCKFIYGFGPDGKMCFVVAGSAG